MPKDLLKFLFSESFVPTKEEVIVDVFERLGEVEALEVKKAPLEKVLKDLGFKGNMEVDENGAFACMDDEHDYSCLANCLKDAENVIKLAELGWVATFGNEVTSNADTPCFRIYFVDICEVEPSDEDKVPDLEKLVQGMQDFQTDGHVDGIGADLKTSKDGSKGTKVPAAPKVKSAIKDSQEPIFEDSFEAVMESFHALDEELQLAVREAAADELKQAGFDEVGTSDIHHSIVRLYREHGNWDEIAKTAP